MPPTKLEPYRNDLAGIGSGWVKLHRKLLDSAIWQNPHVLKFWIYCLLRASHRRRQFLFNSQAVDLAAGQFLFGRQRAARDTGMTERAIRTALLTLKKLEMLTIETTNRYSIITVDNWACYQCGVDGDDQPTDQPIDQQTTSKRPADDHKQECKELKNGKNKEPASRRDVHYDAFATAFELHCGEPYAGNKGDFVQLAIWRKAHPEVGAEAFAGVAVRLWALNEYAPKYAATVRGLCSRWAEARMKLVSVDRRGGLDATGKYANADVDSGWLGNYNWRTGETRTPVIDNGGTA